MQNGWNKVVGTFKVGHRVLALLFIMALTAASNGFAAQMLMVVGSLNGTVPPDNTGDKKVYDVLVARGHTVTCKLASASLGTETGNALILISSSVASGDAAAKFRGSTTPVFLWESAIFDDMGLTLGVSGTDFAGDGTGLSIDMVAAATNPMTAGLTGTVPVFTNVPATSLPPTGLSWGKPATPNVLVASQEGVAGKNTIFTKTTGDALTNTVVPASTITTAPAKRVGYYLGDASAMYWTATGQKLFEAAIAWAMGVNFPILTTPSASNTALSGTVGTAFTAYTLVASGSATITYAAAGLPGGLTITAASGAITGTPTTAGTFTVTVSASNSAGASVAKTLSITINPSGNTAPNITNPATTPLAVTATVGTAYSFNATATGTPTPTFTATGLPAGLTISTSGAITGTPTAGGTASAVLTAANGITPNATKTLNFTVNQAPNITTPAANGTTQNATVNVAFNFTIVASGYPAPTFTATGLPTGLTISTGGVISGTPTVVSAPTATITATNTSGAPTRTLIINVANGVVTAPTITTQPGSATVQLGGTATFTVVASGSSLAYQWKKGAANVTTGTGGTTASYTTAATSATDDGALYTCTVSNTGGSVNTNGLAKLTVETKAGKLTANDVVASRITASELVTTPEWEIPDYVFEKGYKLKSLPELESYLAVHKHLPEMPSAADIKSRGMNLGEVNVQLLKNVEELTLRVIAMQKEMQANEKRLQGQVDSLKARTGHR